MNLKSYLNKSKKSSGITLVALVVTIVVLLILAGITITIIFNDSGIINKAREAAESVDKSHTDTEKELANLVEELGVSLGEAPTIKNKGEIVDKNIKTKYANYTDETSDKPVPVPGGYCVVKDGEGEGEDKQNTVKSGLVISDLAEDTLDNAEISVNGENKKGNQFVWVPVSSEQLKEMYGVDSEGKQHGKLYEFTSSGKENLNWSEENGVMTIESTEGYSSHREPDVVTGSTGTTGSNYDAKVENLNIITDLTTKTADEFKALLQKEFDSMIESVKKYGGFYIGRYETGNLSNEDKEHAPVVQKGSEVGNANWYYQYQESKNIRKENNNVTSSMIWGCQFDRTLEWIAQTNPKEGGTPNYDLLTNSSSWGNYDRIVKTSGFKTKWQKNHIYDLAGNAWDWTLEAFNTYGHVVHGGYYSSNSSTSSASFRGSGTPDLNYSLSGFGSRSTIYINLLSTETEENTSNDVSEPQLPGSGAVSSGGQPVDQETQPLKP